MHFDAGVFRSNDFDQNEEKENEADQYCEGKHSEADVELALLSADARGNQTGLAQGTDDRLI